MKKEIEMNAAEKVKAEDAEGCSMLMEKILDTARGAGRIMMSAVPDDDDIMQKGGRANYVTVYDEKVQEYLQEELSRILPEAHFVGEEEGQEVFLPEYESGYTFVVDPIDGTSNFMRDYRLSVTSIALLKDGMPYIGVIINPYADEIFWAEKGRGAYVNGKRLVPNEDPLSHSLVSMGTAPYYADEVTASAFTLGNWYMKRSLDIRRSGSAAWDLCMIAAGRTGLYFEPWLCLWDYAAGACIVEEAGGRFTDLKGEPVPFRGKSSVLAVTKGVAREDYLPPADMLAPDRFFEKPC